MAHRKTQARQTQSAKLLDRAVIDLRTCTQSLSNIHMPSSCAMPCCGPTLFKLKKHEQEHIRGYLGDALGVNAAQAGAQVGQRRNGAAIEVPAACH